jgi:aspartate ammonia-lyase
MRKLSKKTKNLIQKQPKLKKIIDSLDLNKEKELNFWEGVINLITELENYLEFYNIEEIKTKSLNEIKQDLRKIAKGEKIGGGQSELFHYNN